ncbi:hypothetical protein EC9_06510 [Rosistilla ulvae]|uniref:Uncharacterized protein n=1 Tax=Rosistilla ulvae TaxID=1930277 RepID=A0A517LV37_9BACT|nr:hypothetical protein EC9_06510 [Rosistilla ulvae]
MPDRNPFRHAGPPKGTDNRYSENYFTKMHQANLTTPVPIDDLGYFTKRNSWNGTAACPTGTPRRTKSRGSRSGIRM